MSDPHQNILEAASPRVNATVSASAGTGKTWLLVARLLRLLLAGETPASILAITFTEKAATEIRERLTATLREWTYIDNAALKEALASIGAVSGQSGQMRFTSARTSENATASVRQSGQMQRARGLYETLIYAENDIRILTFHAFCREILERFPFEAKVPPGFEICSEEWELQDEALNRLYIEAAGPAQDTTCALQTLFETCDGLFNTNLALRNFLHHRNDWLAYIEGEEEPVQAAARRLSDTLGVTPEDAEHGVPLDETTRTRLETHVRLVAKHGTQTNMKYVKAINDFLKSGAIVDNETLPPLLNCFFKRDGDKREWEFSSNAFRRALGDEYGNFAANLEILIDKLETLKDTVLKRRTLRRNCGWYVAGQRLNEIYQELKLAHRQLDFNDLEWLACRLVNREDDAQWIQYRLNERIRHILVDEFQDTNLQQWQLLKPLLEEMASQTDGGSVFIVGDIKQSIYGFRRADPELQGEVAQWLKQNMDGQLYTNDESRRSSPQVIDFVNCVFSGGDGSGGSGNGGGNDGGGSGDGNGGNNSGDDCGGNDNNDNAAPGLPDFRMHQTSLDTSGGVIFLPFAVKQPADKRAPDEWRHILRDPPAPGNDPPACEEGEWIAAKIEQMVAARVAVHDRDGSVRPLRFGDITLLLRRRTHLDHYERALIKAGIPHSSGRMEKMFGSLEIADMLALLEFLVNHERNLDLAQTLRSPIFAVTDEQLIVLSQTEGDCWFTRLGRLHDDDLQRAHELLSGWIEAARTRLPVHDLLDRVYRESDLIRRYRLAAPDSEEDLIEKNLIDLLDYSLEFESGRYPDIAQFAHHLKRRISHVKDSRTTASAGVEADDLDRVRILTIHQAKGLEAPVVILADCGSQRKSADAYSVLADRPPGGERPDHFLLVPKSGHIDVFTEDCQRRLETREKREATNLLYVALTRARQYLCISGSGSDPEADWYGLLKSRAPETTVEFATMPDTEPVSASGDEMAEVAVGDEATKVSTGIEATSVATGVEAGIEAKRKPLPPPVTLEIHPHALTGGAPLPGTQSGSADDDEDRQLRGEVIHYALKLLSEQATDETLRDTLNARFPQASAHLGEWIEHARQLINDESLHELFDDARYEQVLNEVPISFMHGGEQYFGVIDRVCVSRDAVWLVDYKTHASPDRHAEALKAHYAEQMRAYYLGVSKLWPGRAVRTSLLLTENRQLCDYDFDREPEV